MFSFTHCAAFYRHTARTYPVMYNTPMREGFRQRAMLYDWISSENFYPEREQDLLNMN